MIIYILFIFILFFLLFRYVPGLQIKELSKWTMPLAFTLKVFVGLYFLFIYSAYYGEGELTADAGKFMKESKMLQEVFFQSKSAYFKFLLGINNDPQLIHQYLSETTHWDPGSQSIISDNRNILRIHSIIHFFSFNRPTIHMIIMCFFSMLGIKHLFYIFRKYSKWKDSIIFLSILLIPSLLFWSSSILKEPMMILGFALFTRAILLRDSRRKRLTYVIIGLLLMIAFKSYVLIALIPAIFAVELYRILPRFKLVGSLGISMILLTLFLSIFGKTRDDLVQRMSRKQYDFISVAKGGIHAYADSLFYYFDADQFQYLTIANDSVKVNKDLTAETLRLGDVTNPGKIHLKASDKKWRIYFMNERCDGYLELDPINNSFSQLLKNIPQALINALIRPFPTDPGSWLKYPAILEIWIVWTLLLTALIKYRQSIADHKKIIYGAFIFIFTLALIIGWVTPVLGAIVRYRIPILITFVFVASMLIKPPIKYQRHE